MINAWELALKAFLYKRLGAGSIIGKEKSKNGKARTISLSKAIVKVKEEINKVENGGFDVTGENISALEDYRNEFAHYFEVELDPIIFMLLSKSVIEFNRFIQKWFNKNIMDDENLILLPIGFKLPFLPENFLSKRQASTIASEYVLSVNNRISKLNDDGIDESIVVGFDVAFAGVKNPKNADIIAKVAETANAVPIVHTKKYKITDGTDGGAAIINEEKILESYPSLMQHYARKLKQKILNSR